MRRWLLRGVNVDQQRHRTKQLWAVILLGAAYSGLLFYLHTITGRDVLDGALSISVGLFICSQPAMNMVDLIFVDRSTFNPPAPAWSSTGWIILNVLSMLTGW